MLPYSAPEFYEIDGNAVDLMCACTSDDHNPWVVSDHF